MRAEFALRDLLDKERSGSDCIAHAFSFFVILTAAKDLARSRVGDRIKKMLV